MPPLLVITTPLLVTTHLCHRGRDYDTLLATTHLCHGCPRLRHPCSLRHACTTAARDYDTPVRYDTLVPPRRRLRHTWSLRQACATAARDHDTPGRYDTLVPPRLAITTPLVAKRRLCHRGLRSRHPWSLRHTSCWGERRVGHVSAHCRLH